jgi:hypothetical protein
VEIDAVIGAFAETTDKHLEGIHHGVNKLASPDVAIHRIVFGSGVSSAVAGTPLLVETTQAVPSGRIWNLNSIGIFGNDGHTEVPFNAIPLGASGVSTYNNNPFPVALTIAGGTVSAIAINGTTTGLTSGVFFVPAGGTVNVTYTVAPTTFSSAGTSQVSPTLAFADLYAASAGLELPEFSAQIGSSIDIPSTLNYPRKSQWLKAGERLAALVYNLPATQQIVLTGRITEWEVGAQEPLVT